jgi:hypothetical protein
MEKEPSFNRDGAAHTATPEAEAGHATRTLPCRAWSVFSSASYWTIRRVIPTSLLFIGISFGSLTINDLKADTTTISNAAFAFMLSLSAATFSFARNIEDNPTLRDRCNYAAERLLHAALLLVSCSALKYAWQWMGGVHSPYASNPFVGYVGSVIGIVVGVTFLYSLGSGHAGFTRLNEILWQRYARHPDWDAIVPTSSSGRPNER